MDYTNKFKSAINAAGKRNANEPDVFKDLFWSVNNDGYIATYEEGKGVTVKRGNLRFSVDQEKINVEPYEAPYNPNEVSSLSREDTLKLLDAIKENMGLVGKLLTERERLISKSYYHASYIEGMLMAQIPVDEADIPKMGIKDVIGPILFGVFTWYFIIIIPIAIKMYRNKQDKKFAEYTKIQKSFADEHPEFFELQSRMAEDYYFLNYVTVVEKAKEYQIELEKYVLSGREAWGIDCVGEEFYNAAAIEEIYAIIKSRRADNFKEAINLLDETKYRARMESAQQAILNASEIAAEEEVKQTQYMKNIEKNTHQSATYSKILSGNSRKILYYCRKNS
jgi:hypothetical protein